MTIDPKPLTQQSGATNGHSYSRSLNTFSAYILRKRGPFLKYLREFGGNMSKAAEAAKVSKPTLYALKEADPEFARKWDEAIEAGVDELEEEARRRAYNGVDEPVFFQGNQCGVVRRYSDGLMTTMLKAKRPEVYRENIRLESDLTPQSVEAIAQSLAQALIRAAEARQRQIPKT